MIIMLMEPCYVTTQYGALMVNTNGIALFDILIQVHRHTQKQTHTHTS